jgi:cytochrome c(L)
MCILKSVQRHTRIRLAPLSAFCAAALAGTCGHIALAGAAIQPAFTSALDDSPLMVKLLPNEAVTNAVNAFYETGNDPYKGDPAALADGRKLYDQWCQSCHMPDGSGRIGPSFIGDSHHYARFTIDKGMFEIVYGGATGAMQGFGNRLTQDDPQGYGLCSLAEKVTTEQMGSHQLGMT